MSTQEDYRIIQENELEVIKAIYADDVKEEDYPCDEPLQFSVKVFPQKGSSNMGGVTYGLTFAVLHFNIPLKYPHEIPEVEIGENKGLSLGEITNLKSDLVTKSRNLLGDVMVYQLLSHAQEYLYDHQKRPVGSFHDEMLIARKQLEEQTVRMKLDIEEKERKALKEEILRKQEELKQELRQRKEQRKSAPEDSIVPSPVSSPNSSPVKGDGFPSILKSRTKRKSISAARRRRSNSEGSDSSFSESSEITILEFSLGKTKSQFYKGEIIGSSPRGTTVYAGMSKSGSLIAISEWKFYAKVDKKGREVKINGAGDSMTLEELLKQLKSFEAEMNLLQKLEHPNIVLYYGLKIQSLSDEPGVTYVYIAEDFVRGTTLESYLKDCISLDLAFVRHCSIGILEGLKFLHDNDIVHRFLRDTSVFLETTGNVKMTDYGLERKICELYNSFCRKQEVPDKFPPSIGRGGKKGDIYRFGVIILSLIKGQYVENPPEIPASLPFEIQDFLKKCLTSTEPSRWSAGQLLDHVFIKTAPRKGPNLNFLHFNEFKKEDKLLDHDNEENEIDPQSIPRSIKGCSRLQNEFQILELLGKGGFGHVFKVKNKLDGRIYALKRIRLNPRNKQLNKKITREVKLLSQLNHENVVRYFNSWIETEVVSDDEATSTETPTTNATATQPEQQKSNLVSVRHVNFAKQNSLGLIDNVEDLAPPMLDSEWSVSVANNQVSDESEESDEEDLFGTSFLRIANDESDGIMFESDCSLQKDRNTKYDSESQISNGESKKIPAVTFGSSIANEFQFMYIQMEFCEKSTLRTAIDANLCDDLDRAWRLFREIVEGLVHIHQQGMIHRDLKPVNIFLDSYDHVKIGDFGLATSNIISKTAEESHVLEKEVAAAGVSLDFGDIESQTGMIGTALYVAPELATTTTGIKVSYNQKVDIYSLGIIFFEMFYRPPETGMERIRVIVGLRQQPIVFPSDFDPEISPQVTHIAKWLLSHDSSQRPTSVELLQSDYLPPPHLEEAELRDIFSRTLNNSQSKAYKYLLASCFKQKISPAQDVTFYMEMDSTRPVLGTNQYRSLHFIHKVKKILESVFEKHGATEVNTPLLMPKSSVYENSDTCVSLMCRNGSIVSIPHDLRVSFARYVARCGINHIKRYSLEKVFREKKVYGLHPKELTECAFDIIDSTHGSLISDAEVLSVVFEIIHDLPWLRKKSYTVRLGHTKLLQGVLLYHGVDKKHHNNILKMLADVKTDRNSKSQAQMELYNLGLPDSFITILFSLMEVEDSVAKITSMLKGIIRKGGEAGSFIKEGLHELEVLTSNIETFGLKCSVLVAPTMAFGSHIYSGLLFQVVCNLIRRKNKVTVDVIAAGGRYDGLIQSFRSALSIESDVSSNSWEYSQFGVGISISLDKLIAGFDREEETEWLEKGSVDAVICSLGHHPMSKEKIILMKDFLAHGIYSSILGGSQTLESAEEFCKEIGATFLVILKEGEHLNRIRILEKGRFNERKMSQTETIDFINRTLEVGGESTSSLHSSGITRNDNVIIKQTGMLAAERENSTMMPVNNSSLPPFNISFVVQEREKLANWKKRYENQVRNHIIEILPKIARHHTVEVLGLEVNASIINTLASCLNLHDKDEFAKGVGEAIERHPRQKKYFNSICDDLYELIFEKNASVIIIYGLTDNSYRVLL